MCALCITAPSTIGKYFALRVIKHGHAMLKGVGAVWRLPVVNADGMLQGMLGLNDIALRAEEA